MQSALIWLVALQALAALAALAFMAYVAGVDCRAAIAKATGQEGEANKGRDLERAIAIDNAIEDGREIRDVTAEGVTIVPNEPHAAPELPQVDREPSAPMDEMEV